MSEQEVKHLNDQWRAACKDVMKHVWNYEDSWIFHSSVFENAELGIHEKASYALNVKQPMDFRTIKQNINLFPAPEYFYDAMTLTFNNCSRFNQKGQDAYEMGEATRAVFEKHWQEKRPLISLAFDQACAKGYRPSLDVFNEWKFVPPSFDLVKGKAVQHPRPSGKMPPLYTVHVNRPDLLFPGIWREDLNDVLGKLWTLSEAPWFEKPVWEYTMLPQNLKDAYYTTIKNPMDLSCIQANLPGYPSPQFFADDIRLMVQNCLIFNPPGDSVHKVGQDFLRHFERIWAEVSPGLMEKFHNDVAQGYVVKWAVPRVPPRPQPVAGGKRKAEPAVVHAPPPQPPQPPAVASWRERLGLILAEVKEVKSIDGTRLAWGFAKPLHKYQLDNAVKVAYYDVVKNPMDLTTIKANISLYPSPAEFKDDIELMFHNCFLFNKPGQDTYVLGSLLQQAFTKIWEAHKDQMDASFAADGQKKSREEFLKVRVLPEPFVDAAEDAAKKQRRSIENLITVDKPKIKQRDIKTLADEWMHVKQQLLKSTPSKKYLPKPQDKPDVIMEIIEDETKTRTDKDRIDYQWRKIPRMKQQLQSKMEEAQPQQDASRPKLAVGGDNRIFLLAEY